jgi:hypothetical protein
MAIEGQLDMVAHIWAFDNRADTEAKRSVTTVDAGFKIYLDALKVAAALLSMENRIATSADFSPVK